MHIPNASRRFCQPSDLSARRPALGRDPVQNPAGCLAQAPPATLRRATGPGWRAPPGPRGSGFIEGRHRAAEGCGGDRRSGRSRHSRRRYVAFGTRGASTGRVVCDLARLYVACAPGSHLLCRRRLAFYPRARFHRYRAAIRHLGRALAGSCARSQAVRPLICRVSHVLDRSSALPTRHAPTPLACTDLLQETLHHLQESQSWVVD